VKLARPGSLRSILVTGFVLVSLPLLAALGNAALQMSQLARQSAQLVQEGMDSTRYVQSLGPAITAMQRRTGLWLYTGNAGPRADVAAQHATARTAVTALLSLPQEPSIRDRLLRLRARLDEANREPVLPTGEPERTQAIQALLAAFEPLMAEANALSLANAERTRSALARLQDATEETQRQLLWQVFALVPITIVLSVLFVTLLVRPLRQIDRAIRELGGGQFTHPIEVTGPADLKQLGQQLEWLRTRLLELEEEKNRFLRHMSHELKTPLANLREGTELLMEGAVGELDSAQREVAAILRENGIRLQRMIENLLSFSAWAAKGGALELSEFRLRPLVKSVMDSQQLTLVGQRLRLDLKVPDVAVTADRGKLRLILDNLLSNAVKYTPKNGTIHLWFRMESHELVIDCADTGPGIPAADRERIFEAFYTGPKPPGGHVPGTGIGLSVVMDFVKAHGGDVSLVDGEFPGAHFRITLPTRGAAARKPDAEEPTHAPS